MNKIILLFGLFCSLSSFSLEGNTVTHTQVRNSVNPVQQSNTNLKTIHPLATDFKLQRAMGDKPQVQYDNVYNSVSSIGDWDSNFLIHRDLPTRTSYYSLKTHVKSTLGDVNDSIIGFNIYYNSENYLNIYLKWGEGATDTIDEICAFAHVNDVYKGSMGYSKYPGDWINLTADQQYVDIWSDFGGFTIKGSTETCNLRDNSRILPSDGFDMTMHVERVEHFGRLADLIQIEIDAYDKSGSNSTTFLSPKYAFDALTHPYGVGQSNYSHYPANIGFTNNNQDRVTYSEIVFTYLDETSTYSSDFDVINSTSGSVALNETSNLLKVTNPSKSEMFIKGSNFITTNNDYTAYYDLNIASADVNNGKIGFTSYYDNNNYVNSYLNYNESGEFAGVSFFAKNGGSNQFYAARTPWDSTSFTTFNEPYFIPYNDFLGYITNDPVPSGGDGNFNNIYKDPSTGTGELVLGKMKTIGIGLQVFRWFWINHEVDVYQLSIKAIGLNNLEYTWYSPSICIDAFTFPGGGAKSSLYDTNPSLGIYINSISQAEINNVKNNDCTVNIYDSSEHSFGNRTEGDWTFTGSDSGENWVLSDTTISQDYSNINADSHYLEINALSPNTTKNFSFGGNVKVSSLFGSKSMVGLYPYYLDSDNFLLVSFLIENNVEYVTLISKENGVESSTGFKMEAQNIDLFTGCQIELVITDNTLEIYIAECYRVFKTVDLGTSFSERNLNNSQYGFNFYNASGEITNYKKQAERIYPVTPETIPDPTIETVSGVRPYKAVVNSEVTLPTYKATNCLGETLEHQVQVFDINDTEVTITSNKFTPTLVGYYHVYVTTTDEWAQTTELYYSIAVVEASDVDNTVIVYNGRLLTDAVEKDDFVFPEFVAYDKAGNEIDCKITLTEPDGNVVELNSPSYLLTKRGTYVVTVTAGEGDDTVTFTYELTVKKYVQPVKFTWQTGFVLVFFGTIGALTILLAVILVKKSKKEALEAEKLNEKNRQKALEDVDADN